MALIPHVRLNRACLSLQISRTESFVGVSPCPCLSVCLFYIVVSVCFRRISETSTGDVRAVLMVLYCTVSTCTPIDRNLATVFWVNVELNVLIHHLPYPTVRHGVPYRTPPYRTGPYPTLPWCSFSRAQVGAACNSERGLWRLHSSRAQVGAACGS